MNADNEVIIILLSKRIFLKNTCIDNNKDLYDSSNGIYFYKTTGNKDGENPMDKIQTSPQKKTI